MVLHDSPRNLFPLTAAEPPPLSARVFASCVQHLFKHLQVPGRFTFPLSHSFPQRLWLTENPVTKSETLGVTGNPLIFANKQGRAASVNYCAQPSYDHRWEGIKDA